MKPVDQFLSSVREVFASNRTTDWTQVALVVSAGVGVCIGVGLWRNRRRTRITISGQIDAVVARAGLSVADVAYLTGIANAAGLSAFDVMTRLPLFERATAAALVAKTPPLRPVDGSGYERVRHLRKALGFSPLPAHFWLISTRELVVGDAVSVSGHLGKVVEVNEASFAVELPASTPLGEGKLAPLTIARVDDSRYAARVRALGAVDSPRAEAASQGGGAGALAGGGEGGGGGGGLRRFFFAHDEQPERHQHREFVRVRVSGPVTLHIEEIAGESAEASPRDQALRSYATTGSLLDVSAGGLSLRLPAAAEDPQATATTMLLEWKRAKVRCSFQLGDGPPFEGLAVSVAAVETERPAGERAHVRLSFVSLTDSERDRLSAAVASQQRTPPSPLSTSTSSPMPTPSSSSSSGGGSQ